MLKIYFDWNCITHIKDLYVSLPDFVRNNRDYVIFPFSQAHIQDLLVSKKENNPYYEIDLNLLETICGDDYLELKDNRVYPLIASPRQVIANEGRIITQKNNLLNNLFQRLHVVMRDTVREMLPVETKVIQGANSSNVNTIIDAYISSETPHKILGELLLDACSRQTFCQPQNIETISLSNYLMLDALGFRPEKKDKDFSNILADSRHIMYGGTCDILVSEDGKMSEKAKAMYSSNNRKTRVMDLDSLYTGFIQERERQHSLVYLRDCIEKTIENKVKKGEDSLHLNSPVMGLFDTCQYIVRENEQIKNATTGLFRFAFSSSSFLFYREILRFYNMMDNIFSQAGALGFKERFVMPILSKSPKEKAKAYFRVDSTDMDFAMEFHADQQVAGPLPIMLFAYGDKFKAFCDKNTL